MPVNQVASAAIAQLRKEKVRNAIESSFYQVQFILKQVFIQFVNPAQRYQFNAKMLFA
jgi:hypothetical protein